VLRVQVGLGFMGRSIVYSRLYGGEKNEIEFVGILCVLS
jgi:hypothetical protein